MTLFEMRAFFFLVENPMPPPPPLEDVFAALKHTVIPAAAGAALIYALFLAICRRSLGALGSALAILAGMAYANWVELRLPWKLRGVLLEFESKDDRKGWDWYVYSAIFLVAVGLVTRWLGQLLKIKCDSGRWWWTSNLVVWLLRLPALYFIATLLVPVRSNEPVPTWIIPAFAAAMFLEWIILDSISRAGNGATVTLIQSAMLMAGGSVILYAHSARFMDVSVMAAMAYFGIAVVAIAAQPVETSGSIPAGIVLLPGLLLSTKLGTDSKVPDHSFWIVALAPLVLAPWMIPALTRKNGWINFAIRWLLVLTPLVIAVILAGQKESLPWEEEW
jgi:hypothetical protein